MTDMALLVDLHKRQARQGPGSEADTLRALALTGLSDKGDLRIADIGCGTGASTLTLATALHGEITAVDFLPEFLEELETQTVAAGLEQRIRPLQASMDQLPLEEETLDLIWSEGAIYNMGFEQGLAAWRPLLKPAGILAVSEITWLVNSRDDEIQSFWEQAYPQIDTAAGKFQTLERQGYSPIGYFPLPISSWMDNYYQPLAASFESFLQRHHHSEAAREVVAEHQEEQALYEKYSAQYSYGFYVARKSD